VVRPGGHRLRGDDGEEHLLSRSEYDLLKAFADHPRRILSRERLLALADARDPDALDRAIDVRINRIRKKIEPVPNEPQFIQTVRGWATCQAGWQLGRVGCRPDARLPLSRSGERGR
jgi:DNA-binding response OmpR family regulator